MFLALSNSGSKPLKMIDFQLLLAQLKADLCTQTVVTRVLCFWEARLSKRGCADGVDMVVMDEKVYLFPT